MTVAVACTSRVLERGVNNRGHAIHSIASICNGNNRLRGVLVDTVDRLVKTLTHLIHVASSAGLAACVLGHSTAHRTAFPARSVWLH